MKQIQRFYLDASGIPDIAVENLAGPCLYRRPACPWLHSKALKMHILPSSETVSNSAKRAIISQVRQFVFSL